MVRHLTGCTPIADPAGPLPAQQRPRTVAQRVHTTVGEVPPGGREELVAMLE